ncbi:MAG: nitroreductase family deazaflavin-dependent oxidoreductase [Promethearchaeota archaeon]|jgi:deazaflavin-dependent oxidoreductase (nitroreductase family)
MSAQEELLPRPGSPLYKMNHEDEKKKKKTLKRWTNINKFLVLPLYRLRILPLFGFGKIFLILTTKGRKTGKKRRTPLEYHRIDQIITIFSSRGEEAGWVKNMRKNPNNVFIKYGFHSFIPRVEFITDESQKLEIIKWYVINHGKSARMLFGWDRKFDDPETTDFSKLLSIISIIRLYPKSD